MPADAPCITLTDNGSLRPEATFSLRRLSRSLSEAVNQPVHPVSLLHSNKIPAGRLEGRAAEIIEPFFLRKRSERVQAFLVVPLFFGPSAAIVEYLPERVEWIRREHSWPELEVRVAPCLVDRRANDDTRLARILAELIDATASQSGLSKPSVALVDHGSPRIEVTEVRNLLARQLEASIGDRFAQIAPASMERRKDAKYDFNEPLLERLLGQEGFRENVIVSMLFLQPGRHAGPGGDVAGICRNAEEAHPDLKTYMTGLVGEHPGLIDLLAERLHKGIRSAPVVRPRA